GLLEAGIRLILNGLPIGFVNDVQHRLSNQFVDAIAQLLRAEAVSGNDGSRGIHDKIHRRVTLKSRSPLLLAVAQPVIEFTEPSGGIVECLSQRRQFVIASNYDFTLKFAMRQGLRGSG